MASLIQVDWRKGIAPSKLLSDMQVILTNMDQSGIAAIELAEPRTRNASKLEEIDGTFMWVR